LLSWPARRVVNRPGGVHVGEQDIHDEATESWIALDAVIDGARARWSVDGQRGRGNRADVRDLEQAARPVRDALQKSAGASVPLFVYYPAHRVVRAMPEPSRKREKLSQIAAHDAALDGQPDFTRFFAWLRQQDDGAPGRRGRSRGGQRDPRLLAVHRAFSSVVPGFSDLRIDGNPGHVRVRKQGRDLAFERLSDGERHLLAMAGDLALRLALANPASKDPLQGHGIVLIDEIELHLHPTWQRQIIPALARAFPRCQFVVSTHAPLVIGSVPREAVQVLEDGRLVDMRVHTRGRDATAILAELMGVPPHPPDVTEALLEIGRLIEQSRYEEARVQVDALARDLGDEDAAIVRNRGLLDFLEAPPRPRIAPAGRKKLSRK
jgi:predicted ATP-binding protein involved in virulence